MSDKNQLFNEAYFNSIIYKAVKEETKQLQQELDELKKQISPHQYYKTSEYVMKTYCMSKSTLYRLMKSGEIKYKKTKGGKRLIDITTVLDD